MSCKVASKVIDVHVKVEIITLQDCFGAQHKLQIPLLGEQDADAIIAQELEAMSARCDAFEAKALARGYDVEQMKKDCGCQ